MGMGKLDVSPLISHRFPIAQAEEAYDLIESGTEPHTAIVLAYPDSSQQQNQHRIEFKAPKPKSGKLGLGVLGAGNFARLTLLPAIENCGQFEPVVICSAGGVSAGHTGQKRNFAAATTDEAEVFSDPAVDAIFSITQHNQHARHVLQAIQHRKHLFVEKPLCLTLEELAEIETALQEAGEQAPLLMVGFNRRFSPAVQQVKEFFSRCLDPLTVSIRFNAGTIPADHWTQQAEIGGGRIIGEACHAIDLATWLTGSLPVRVYAESIGGPQAPEIREDQSFLTLRHANGSISNIAYLAGGDKAFPKERVEVFGGGLVGVIEDFRRVITCRGGKMQDHQT